MEEDFIELGTGPTAETEHSERKNTAQTARERIPPPQRRSQGGYKGSRFNALRHEVLSGHTVLPWEDREEYSALLGGLVEEYAPRGPTEEHLIEEIASVIWRKRRLRLAEAASYQRGLGKAADSFSNTLEPAPIPVERRRAHEAIIAAVLATPLATAADLVELKRREASAKSALRILGAGNAGAYEAALAKLDEPTRTSWQEQLSPELEDPDEDGEPYTGDATGLAEYLERSVLPGYATQLFYVESRFIIRTQALGDALDLNRLEPLGRYEVQLDRKLERMLAMLLRLQSLRRPDEAG
jgi:hypothetical protein